MGPTRVVRRLAALPTLVMLAAGCAHTPQLNKERAWFLWGMCSAATIHIAPSSLELLRGAYPTTLVARGRPYIATASVVAEIVGSTSARRCSGRYL
jgi:hypothetical protein